MTELSTGMRALVGIFGAAVLVYCWLRAVRTSPRTAPHAAERWAVALLAMAGLIVVLGALLVPPWVAPGLLAGLAASAALVLLGLAHKDLAYRPSREPQDWRD